MLSLLNTEKAKNFFKEGFWVFFGQALAIAGSLVGVQILTKLLKPEIYGELALSMTIVSLVTQLLYGPLSAGVTRFYVPALEKDDLNGYLKAVKRLLLLASYVAIFITLFINVGIIISGRLKWISISIAALFFSIFSGANAILTSIQYAARQRIIVALHQGVESWVRYLLSAALILMLGAVTTTVMAGYTISAIFLFVSQLYFLRVITSKKNEDAKEICWQDQIWKYSWPFASWGLFTWAQLSSDRWALAIFTTNKEVGLYTVLFQLGYYPASLATGLGVQLLTPIIYERAGDGNQSHRNENVHKLTWHLTLIALSLTGIAFLVSLLLHKFIFKVFAANEYGVISYLLPWLVLSGGVFAAGQTITLELMSQMKTRQLAVVKIVTSIMGILFNIAGAYFFGIKGIVIASILFSIIYFIWIAFLSKNKRFRQFS